MKPFRTTAGIAMLAAIAGSAFASEEGGGAAALIQPEIGTLFWTVVTFLLLAFVLGKFAWKPLLGAIQERERSIEDSLRQAREGREQAEKLLEEHRALVAQAQRERAEAVENGRVEAERLRGEILDEARSQKEQVLAQTQEQVAANLRQAREELRDLTVDLAIQAAGKLLSKNVDDPTQRRLVEDYLTDLESQSSDTSGLPS